MYCPLHNNHNASKQTTQLPLRCHFATSYTSVLQPGSGAGYPLPRTIHNNKYFGKMFSILFLTFLGTSSGSLQLKTHLPSLYKYGPDDPKDFDCNKSLEQEPGQKVNGTFNFLSLATVGNNKTLTLNLSLPTDLPLTLTIQSNTASGIRKPEDSTVYFVTDFIVPYFDSRTVDDDW